MLVYSIINKINGKSYIGCTKDSFPNKRWNEHKRHYNRTKYSNLPLYRAFKKYGIDSFEFSVIVDGIESLNDLIYAERYLIAYYNTKNSKIGYNCRSGGEGFSRGIKKVNTIPQKGESGRKPHTEDTIKKLSEIKKSHWASGVYSSDEYRNKQIKAKSGVENILKRKKVICNETKEVFDSLELAALHFSGSKKKAPNIISNLKGRTSSAYGHTFSYAN